MSDWMEIEEMDWLQEGRLEQRGAGPNRVDGGTLHCRGTSHPEVNGEDDQGCEA